MDLHTLLVIGHVVGTILGVGGATLAEVQMMRALKDGVVDASERALMHANYTAIRVGLAIIVISGLALVWWQISQGNNWVLTSAKLWFKDLLVVFIIVNAVLLTKRWIPFWLGSAVSFTSWWMATILGMWKKVPYDFIHLLIAYILIVFLVAGILAIIKRLYLPPIKAR